MDPWGRQRCAVRDAAIALLKPDYRIPKEVLPGSVLAPASPFIMLTYVALTGTHHLVANSP